MNNNSGYVKTHKVAIVGANGYSGQELAKIVLRHPMAELKALFSRDPAWQLADDVPEASGINIAHLPLTELEQLSAGDTVFLATPADVSIQLVPQLLADQIKVIDLSGAFRLPASQFEKWYGINHNQPDLIEQAQYGLCPWWLDPGNAQQQNLIANPGCYPTAALMALIPLVKAGIISPQGIFIDAKSGVSGAGRKAVRSLLFCEIDNNFYPYKIGKHQHLPEIGLHLSQFSAIETNPLMVTHLLPLKRGLSLTIYASLEKALSSKPSDELNKLIATAFNKSYDNYPLARHGCIDDITEGELQRLTALTHVIGTPRVHIGYKVQQNHLIVVANIDNLMKGAASQAIENFNVVHGLPITTGLI